MTKKPSPPKLRTFGLNSPEFHEAVRAPGTEAWIPNGSLRREPRSPDRKLVIEGKDGQRRKVGSEEVVKQT
ncbi:MAG: hypothetical protein V4444_00700 [Pseudomonadota bacterium]